VCRRDGHPAIPHLADSAADPGPGGDPRVWTIAHWQGAERVFREITRSIDNFDTGSMDLVCELL
jgi:hypothetical protein